LRFYFSGFGKEFQTEINSYIPDKYNNNILNFSGIYNFSYKINTRDYKTTIFKYSVYDMENCEEESLGSPCTK